MKRPRKYRRIIATAVGVTGLLFATTAAPVSAAGPGEGELAFAGAANPNDGNCTLGDNKDGACLPEFPALGGDGDFDGDASGSASGLDGSTAWSVVADSVPLHADFTYNEDPAVCPVQGDANGTFSASGAATGTYGTTNVVGVDINGSFAWDRAGLTAAITFTVDVTLELAGGGTVLVIDDAAGAGSAAFDPSPNASDCAGDSITATVVGDATFATT